MTKYTRRELLRIASANIALGVATGTAVANGDPAASTSDPITTSDLHVRNQSSDPVTVSVRFFNATNGERTAKSPVLTVERDLGTGSTAVAEERLALSGGEYVVEVTTDDGTTEETTWGVPPSGVTDWLTFSIRVLPTGDLSIGPLER
jgi:hypothetical protein